MTIGRIVGERIHTSADLDAIIDQLPPARADVPADRLGGPALMSPVDVRDWIRAHRQGPRRTELGHLVDTLAQRLC